MRITFLLTQSLQGSGGGGRYLPLAQALARRGHQVQILALHDDYARTPQRRFQIGPVAVWYVGQMHVLRQGGQRRYYSAPGLLWVTLVSTLRLTWALLRTPTEVIQVCKTQPMNAVAAWVAHVVRGLPVYLDNDDYEALNNRFAQAWQQRLVAWFENWMPSFAAGITVSTAFMAEHFKSLGYPPGRIRLVPHGIDLDQFSVLERPEAPAVLERLRQGLHLGADDLPVVYVGSMSLLNHAVDLLLEAFVVVGQQEPRARLLLVGDGEDLASLKQLAERLGLATRAQFVGRVERDLIPYYYGLGLVSVDPKRDTQRAHSSLSIKLIESIAAAVPCVTADTGDSRQRVGEAGRVVPPGQAPALAEALLRLLHAPADMAAMRAAARDLRPAYTWEVLAQRFEEEYQTG